MWLLDSQMSLNPFNGTKESMQKIRDIKELESHRARMSSWYIANYLWDHVIALHFPTFPI